MNIYVGNLSYEVTEEDLKEVFKAFGQIDFVKIIKDKFTGESKGFGFVEMPNEAEAQAAIQGVSKIKERQVKVNEAKPRTNTGFHGNNGKKTYRDNKF